MNHQDMRERIHACIDRRCASLGPDPHRVQRVLHAANRQERMEQQNMRRKLPFAVVLIVCLLLLSGVALAAVFMNLHMEKAMDLVKDRGEFSQWTLEDKLALMEAMTKDGIALPEAQLRAATDASASWEQRDQAAAALLESIYGSTEHISHFTIASHDWGDPFLWTLEQKVWFWERLREKGLYTGAKRYLLPGEEDLTCEQAADRARKAVQAAWGLSDETVRAYDADVTFFTIDGVAEAPRWLVYLGHANEQHADYAVLLTQEGEVTEDASLFVFSPERMAAQQRAEQSSAVETPFQKRWKAAETLYLSSAGQTYHYLQDCPAVAGEDMMEAAKADEVKAVYSPCPYCVQRTELWSAEDKLRYGVMAGAMPGDDVISAEEAVHAARTYLLNDGWKDAAALIPSVRYHGDVYAVFFIRLADGQMEYAYAVIVDAHSGEVRPTSAPEAKENG